MPYFSCQNRQGKEEFAYNVLLSSRKSWHAENISNFCPAKHPTYLTWYSFPMKRSFTCHDTSIHRIRACRLLQVPPATENLDVICSATNPHNLSHVHMTAYRLPRHFLRMRESAGWLGAHTWFSNKIGPRATRLTGPWKKSDSFVIGLSRKTLVAPISRHHSARLHLVGSANG
jgi:hypothetical protein